MRISAAFVALAATLIPATSARGFFGGNSQVEIAKDGLKIPGNSPLELCDQESHDEDLITIEKVVLTPNPPKAGETLIIEAKGTVKETIEDGAYVMLQIKYGLIRLISTKADLCEQIQNVDMTCPINKGYIEIRKEVDLPAEIPPGKYTVFADVYSKDDEPITCLTATVVFGVHKADGSSLFDFEL